MADTRVLEFKQVYSNGKATDMVLLGPAGEAMDKVQTWHRVAKLMPEDEPDDVLAQSPSFQARAGRWKIVGPAYEAWKAGTEVPEHGVPLAAWSGVTKEQADVLRKLGMRTVEDLTTMSDSIVGKLPWPNSRKLPQMAKAYLAGEDTASMQAEKADMQAKMEAMEEMIAELMAAKAEKIEDAPKRRGRPPKSEAA